MGFLNQTSKAKGTECTSKFGALLGTAGADALADAAAAKTAATAQALAETNASDLCTFSVTVPDSTGNNASTIITGTVAGKGELASKYYAKGCLDYSNGKRDVTTGENATGTADAV